MIYRRSTAVQDDRGVDALAFVVVQDVAASWATYPGCDLARADGLLLHAAGPTDEGFRTVDVWTSEEAYRRHVDCWPPGLAVPPVVRSLYAVDLSFWV